VSASEIKGWKQRLPRRGPCDRAELLLEFSTGKRVVHVGFVDEKRMEAKLEEGKWLHARLAAVADSIVGVDSAEDGVEWAKEQGFEAYAVDAQSPEAVAAIGLEPADVVVAGEIIEHLDAPGPFLRAMRELLKNLLERNGWSFEGMAYYQNPAPRMDGVFGPVVRGLRGAFVAFGKLLPYWCDGLVAWARPAVAP
jgi:hypothetical protein